MTETLRQLFLGGAFMPHGHCYFWNGKLSALHVASDAVIFLAYTTIPVTLLYIIRERKDIPFDWMFLCFGTFIVACGTTHLLEIWNVWHSAYWLSGIVKAVTAVASIGTAALLIRLVPTIRTLPSPGALRESERKFRALAGGAPDAIVSANGEGRIVYANRAAERFFGRSQGDLIGEPLSILMPERHRQGHEEGFRRFLSGAEARVVGRTVELSAVKKDGTEFPIELSLSSWKTDKGTYFTAIMRDITQRRRDDEEIRRLNDDLQAQAAELAETNKELESFSYSVSHDLRAPLRSIDGFSQAVLEDEKERLSPEGRLSLARVRSATQRMGELIDDMLALSRITRKALAREPVDVTAMAQEVLEDLRQAGGRKLVIPVVHEGMSADGDRVLLRAALENLIGNAWKFTSKTAGARIEVGTREDAAEGKVFFVKDNGAGFNMAYADKLFGAFQRLHAAAEFPGTGVGLATVQRIIRRHGGRVWAEGQEGRGAVFYFTLPVPPGAKIV
jgi:PAS domain S-box-containing protein